MAKQIEEGKIGKWLAAPLRRHRAIAKSEKYANKNKEIRDSAKYTADRQEDTARKYKETGQHYQAKKFREIAKNNRDTQEVTARRSATGSLRAYRLSAGTKATPFGGLKENMDPIQSGIKNVQEGNLEQMRNNFNDALARKAAEALQEKKLEIASSYFGK